MLWLRRSLDCGEVELIEQPGETVRTASTVKDTA
jgi:hypothetical protein